MSNILNKNIVIISFLIVFLLLYKFLGKNEIDKTFKNFTPINISNSFFNKLPLENNQDDFLLILFKLDDCPLCLFEAEYWGQFTSKNNHVKIIGISNAGNQAKLNEFIDEYGLSFTIYNDKEYFNGVLDFLDSINIESKTPIKLFIQNSKLIAVEKGIKDIDKQNKFVQRANKIFNNLN